MDIHSSVFKKVTKVNLSYSPMRNYKKCSKILTVCFPPKANLQTCRAVLEYFWRYAECIITETGEYRKSIILTRVIQ